MDSQSCTGWQNVPIHAYCAHHPTGLATVANMGAEVGATTSTFPYSANMRSFLYSTGRGPVARAADEAARSGLLSADPGAEYDELIEIVSLLIILDTIANVTRTSPN